MKRLLVLTLVVFMVLGLFGGVAGATYDFPSTNELNRDKEVPGREGQDAPHVNLVSAGADYVELEFVGGYAGLAFFEYRIDGEVLTSGIAHPVVTGDYIYPGVAVIENEIVERTFNADGKVEIRLALGGERDWDFDWTTFYVEPAIEYEAAPAVAVRLLADANVDNRYGKGRNGGNFIADVARHMGDTTDFDGVSKEDVGAYECAVAAFLNDPANGEPHYPAGVECTPQYESVDTVQVTASGTPVLSNVSLEQGITYLVRASGTYRFANWGEYGIADAAWNYRRASNAPGGVAGWYQQASQLLQVWINDSAVNWQPEEFNSDHIYDFELVGSGSKLTFMIYDSYYGDNSGSIDVEIFIVNW